jgi:iron complex outermembrane receptor protein
MINLKLSSAVSTLALAAIASPAFAQVDPTIVQPAAPVTPRTPIDDNASTETPANRAEGDEIIVTARRVSENLQSVPVAIVAFSQNTLNERAISNAFDLAKSVPGLVSNADSGNAALPSFSIRGRGQFFGAASGSVETYFADVPLSAPFQVPTLPPQFFDLASVQVLKGPQGTLFGRNTTGGAVLFVPQAPTSEFEGYVRGQLGTYSNRQLEAAVNLPFGEVGGLRLAGFISKRNGYARTVGGRVDGPGTANAGGNFLSPTGPKVLLPSIDIYNQDFIQARATLLLNLSDSIQNTTIVTWHGDKNRATTQLRQLRPGAPLAAGIGAFFPGILPNDPRVADVSTDLRKPRSSTWAFINTTLFDINDDLRIKNILSHIRAKGWGNNPSDVDGSPFPAIDLERPNRFLQNWQTVEELQLQGTLGPVDFIIGGLLDRTRQPSANDQLNITTNTYDTGGFDMQFRESRYSSEALFGSLTFHATDRLTLSAAARHSWDDIVERSIAANNLPQELSVAPAPGTYPTCGAVGVPTTAACAPPLFNGMQKFKGWSYNATADFQATDDILIYGGYRHGYKRGGFNARGAIALGFGPEEVDDYFVGLKTTFEIGGRRSTFNVEGFWDQYQGAQRAYLDLAAGSLVTTIQNVPGIRYRGFDTDLVFNLTDWFRLAANYTYVDAEFTDYPDLTVATAIAILNARGAPQSFIEAFRARNGDGRNLQRNNIPGQFNKHKLNVQGRFHHRFDDGVEVAFLPSVSYQSEYYINDAAFAQPAIGEVLFNGGLPVNGAAAGATTVPGYTTVDARLEFNNIADKFDISFNVTNLTNKTFLLGGAGIYQFGVDSVAYGPPRMYFVEARLRF